MEFLALIVKNILALPSLCFAAGILLPLIVKKMTFPEKITDSISLILLLIIGIKGGISLQTADAHSFFIISLLLILWGLLQPFLSYGLLKRFSNLDTKTIAAIAGCFGSVSVMTFIAATGFLEMQTIPYKESMIATLSIMEIPGIIAALILGSKGNAQKFSLKDVFKELFFNKAILMLVCGIFIGYLSFGTGVYPYITSSLVLFKPALCLFLGLLGIKIGLNMTSIRSLSLPVILFGIYMPMIGAMIGLSLSYLIGLDIGTATLVACIAASASYIAVPAAVRIAFPTANETVYLPLSLGITFPFNVAIGIPIYYQIAKLFLR